MANKHVPASCDRKLSSAERRLVGAIARAEPRARLVADAERVRRAQLGVIKARERVANIPTAHEDAQLVRHVANLEAAARTWQALSVDDIVARYAAALASGSSLTLR
jgi:hypothetical protein